MKREKKLRIIGAALLSTAFLLMLPSTTYLKIYMWHYEWARRLAEWYAS